MISVVARPGEVWQWLGGAENATATLLSLAAIFLAVRATLRRTVFRRRLFRQALDSLAIGVNREYVVSLLGPPAFGHLDDSGDGVLVWVSVHGYVHLCFNAGAAEQIAVTLTDPWLRYNISRITQGSLKGRLGKAVRAEGAPDGVYAFRGARRVSCVLTFWGGNPGGYLHHTVAYNDASGLGDYPQALIDGNVSEIGGGRLASNESCEPDCEFVTELSRQLVPNTVIVSRDSKWLEAKVFGVDLDVVRLFRRKRSWAEAALYRYWRWRWRWRLRQRRSRAGR